MLSVVKSSWVTNNKSRLGQRAEGTLVELLFLVKRVPHKPKTVGRK